MKNQATRLRTIVTLCITSAASISGCATGDTLPSVKMKDGRTGYYIGAEGHECRDETECEEKSNRRCRRGYDIVDRTVAERNVPEGGGDWNHVNFVKKAFHTWLIVCDDNKAKTPGWNVVDVTDQPNMAANVASREEVRRRNNDAVCELRPGPLRDEETKLFEQEFGPLTCHDL